MKLANDETVLTVTIAVGVQDRPSAAPLGPWKSDYKIVARPSFAQGISAVTTMIFAYTGTPFYFAIVSEMRDPRQYHKSMIICQGVVTITYITIGIVIYYFCGSYVASPALGSAGGTIKIISYATAIPGLCVSGTVAAHVSYLIPQRSPYAC